MKKRLRKKKRVGEFRELGFGVRATFRDGMTDVAHEAFVDAWIDFIEARGLLFGGGGGGVFEGFVTRGGRGSATDEDRAAVLAFLEGHEAVVASDLGALVDAWR